MLGRPLGALHRVVFEPWRARPSVVGAIALAPPVAAGLVLFRLPAAEALGAAVLAGILAHAACRLVGLRLPQGPIPAAVVGVALAGAGASRTGLAVIVVTAVVLEVLRGRFTPGARVQAGLVAYSAVLLATHGAPASYLNPSGAATPAEPVRLWLEFYGSSQSPIDPVRLYVGNVPGPMFATSLLAVAVGAAWLWYARRLSLLTLVAFLAGTLPPIVYLRWSPVLHLDSGPLWFTAALLLADRRLLTGPAALRPLLGLVAGGLVMGARLRGFSIEAVPVVVAGLQLAMALLAGAAWLAFGRRRRPQAPLPAASLRRPGGGPGAVPPGRPGPAARPRPASRQPK